MRPGARHASRLLGLFGAAFLLTACQTELYKEIDGREANEMVALLHNNGIEASKKEEKDNLYTVFVDESFFARAVDLLRAHGLPRRKHQSLVDIFQSSGLVPTPFEERVRYIYGLSEELAHTLSLFEGVIDTRVHVVLPSFQDGRTQSIGKASVYVRYDQGVDFNSLVPSIKKLVSDGVEGIAYENVELLAVPVYVKAYETEATDMYAFPAGIRVRPEHYRDFMILVSGIALVIAHLLGGLVWLFVLYRRAGAKPAV